MRPAVASIAAACLLLAGLRRIGGRSSRTPTPLPATAGLSKQLWRAPGDDVAVVAGTAEPRARPGPRLVPRGRRGGRWSSPFPTARVWVARGLEAQPFLESTAKLERIGVPGMAEADATHIYVAELQPARAREVLAPGRARGRQGQGAGARQRRRRGGQRAGASAIRRPASETPDDRVDGRRLLRADHADAARRDRCSSTRSPTRSTRRCPSSSRFSTPKYCSSRDVRAGRRRRRGGLAPVRARPTCGSSTSRCYEGNDPANGYNRWMKEWGLRTEPWTFVVGRDGRGRRAVRGRRLGARARGRRRAADAELLRRRRRRARSRSAARGRAGSGAAPLRTSSATSSAWIISSAGMPVQSVIFVATNAGQIATARTPCRPPRG